MPKWLDLPPIWLIAMMVLGYAAAFAAPAPDWPVPWVGAGVMALGVGLTIWAALGFRAAKTTIVPHQAPSALITTGAFACSRNPIYLADVLVLIGWALILGAGLALLPAVIFVWIIRTRFISPEEERLSEAFGETFESYKATVGRWI